MAIFAADIVGLQAAISSNPDVIAAALLRHGQQHSLTSSADHSDVNGAAPTDGQIMGYSAGAGQWGPASLTVTYTGGDIDEGTC